MAKTPASLSQWWNHRLVALMKHNKGSLRVIWETGTKIFIVFMVMVTHVVTLARNQRQPGETIILSVMEEETILGQII